MDKTTNLGMTIKEYRVQNGEVSIDDACRRASERMRGAKKEIVELGSLSVDGGSLSVDGKVVANMDDFAWTMFAKLLDIPTPYLMRLGTGMREANVGYWLDVYRDKEVSIVYRDMELVDMSDGVEVQESDVLDILNARVPGGIILRAFSQTNSVVWDVVDLRKVYAGSYDTYFPGMRVVVKKGLNAPEVSPIFVSENSCGTIECADYFDKLNIKSMSYGDILRLVSERVIDCTCCMDGLFEAFKKVEGEEVRNPRRRVALYCREHGIPSRIRSYCLERLDGARLRSTTYSNIIALFSTIGFVDEVKQSSERKLQKLAGHIITKAKTESRCSACDSLEVEL